MLRFKDFILEEGQFWDALCHGAKTGFEAFKEKRSQQKERPVKPNALTQKILTANGEQLKILAKEIVANGYTIRGGQVSKPKLVKKSTDWLIECTNIKTESSSGKLRKETSIFCGI